MIDGDRQRIVRSTLLVWIAVVVVGCTTTRAVSPMALASLDGFDAQQPSRSSLVLQTLDGPTTFNHTTRLQLDLPTNQINERFVRVQVRDGRFVGQTAGGEEIGGPLNQVRAARVEKSNPPLTILVLAGLVGAAALGILVLTASSESHGVAGRPLRIGGKLVAAPVGPGEGWQGEGAKPDVAGLSDAARAALAAIWTESARGEHASVPAFSRLSLALMAVGAPARLVEAAHRAALDEIEHARRSFALASCYGGEPVEPGELSELRFAPTASADGLLGLAQESLLDGCLNEGLAAAVAVDAATRAGDPAVRETLSAIARDEAGHADLAWEIVGWCCEQSGVELHRALRQALRLAPTPTPWWNVPEDVIPELVAHGWPGSAAWPELAARTRDEVANRLEQLVFRHDHPERG